MSAVAETIEHVQKQEVIVATSDETTLSIRASDLVAAAGRATASCPDTVKKCVDLVGLIKRQAKAVDDERRKIVDPLNGVVKHVNGRFKPITDALNSAEGQVKRQILAYQQEQERKQREEAARKQREMEEKALADAAAAQAAGNTIMAEATVDRASRITHREAPVGPIAGGETGASANVQKRWTFRVNDLAALAKAYPDCVEVKNSGVMGLYRAGIKQIPGVEFYQEDVVAIR